MKEGGKMEGRRRNMKKGEEWTRRTDIKDEEEQRWP